MVDYQVKDLPCIETLTTFFVLGDEVIVLFTFTACMNVCDRHRYIKLWNGNCVLCCYEIQDIRMVKRAVCHVRPRLVPPVLQPRLLYQRRHKRNRAGWYPLLTRRCRRLPEVREAESRATAWFVYNSRMFYASKIDSIESSIGRTKQAEAVPAFCRRSLTSGCLEEIRMW